MLLLLRALLSLLLLLVCSPLPSPPSLSLSLQAEAQDKDAWNKEDKTTENKDDEEGGEEGGEDYSGGGSNRKASLDSTGAAHAQEQASSGGGLDDLLGLGGSAPAPAPAAVDPLTVPVTVRKGIDASLQEQVGKWFSGVVSKPSSVLYEDASIQIGVKKPGIGFGGAEGKLTLFIGNRASVPLVAFKVRVPDFPAVKVTVGDVPSTVGVKQQVQVPITVECMSPFTDPPALQISFISQPGTGHAYPLKLPIAVNNFCESFSLAAPDYKTRWGQLAGQPREATAMITPASGADVVTKDVAIKALEVVQMSNIEAGAPGATGASSFRTHTMTASGQHVSVGSLAMIIPDAANGLFKVAVRTQHADVSKALITVLQNYLGGL